MWIVLENSPGQMRFEEFGNIQIFRPRLSSEVELRVKAEKHLRSKYAVGKYTDKETINEILQHQFSFFTDLLEQLLTVIASLDFLKFLLLEYDKTAQIDRLYKSNQLNEEEKARWAELGPKLRRAAKYLAERVVLLAPEEALSLSKEEALTILEKVWICAEQLVRYYILSDQTFLIFPDSTTLEIFPEDSYNYLTLEIDNQCASEIQERIRLDTINRDRFVPKLSFDINSAEHERVLAAAFQGAIGISYQDALTTLGNLIDRAEAPKDGFPIPFLHRDKTLASLSQYLNFSPKSIKQVLEGFSISKLNLESEGREIWKPKQEYRAFRRGIFEVPHSIGTHLIFSKEMARECLLQLVGGVVFKQLPPEWRSDEVNLALETLSNEAGKWFEQVVLENLERANILGAKSSKSRVGQGDKQIPIPPDVGEIDYLGYAPEENLLVVAECKMVRSGFEPRYFRDEISEFVTKRNAYFEKFQKKVDWIRANLTDVCQALSSIRNYETPVNPSRVATAVITLYPTIASCFTNDFPCVTITEIMMGYETKGRWPYEMWLHPW